MSAGEAKTMGLGPTPTLTTSRITVMAVVVALAIAIPGALAYHAIARVSLPLHVSLPQALENLERDTLENRLAQEIRFYDEILTQSARNYAFTGEPKWKERYQRIEPDLDRCIKQAMATEDQEDIQSFQQIDAANVALVDLEHRSLAAVDEGRRPEAQAILDSEEYGRQKAIYARGLERYVARQSAETSTSLTRSSDLLAQAVQSAQRGGTATRHWIALATLIGLATVAVLFVLTFRFVKAEAASRVADARYRALFVSSSDAFMTIAPPSWRFTSANPATVEMFGARDEAEFISLGPWEVSPEFQPDGRPSAAKAREMIAIAIRKGSLFFEWTHRRLHGEAFPATVLLTRLELAGQPLVQATVRDIHLQKQAEAEHQLLESHLRRAEKLEAVGQLAGGIAHEFNNQLAIINGFTELILRQVKGDAKLAPKLEQILQAGQRSAKLTEQLLAYSRTQEIRRERFDLNTLVHEMAPILLPLVPRNINVVLHLTPEACDIVADRGQIADVISHLCTNARDAMPQGGVLTIETAHVDLGDRDLAGFAQAAPGPYVRLRVSDTGEGMDADTQARLFEPFFTTKEVGKGTGLGLPFVHGVVEQAHGMIAIESTKGKGTVVSVCVPRLG